MVKYSPAITTDFILVDILKELKEINFKLDNKADKPKAKPTKICETCGEVHEHAWQYGVCARKNKKKE